MKSAAVMLVISGVLGCTSNLPTETEPAPEAEGFQFATDAYEIPAGDVFTCFYTDVITDEELAVVGALGAQSEGGHHITVYYTHLIEEPQFHECAEDEMLTWNQVAGAAIDPDEFTLDMPEGLAMRVPEGAQLVLQTHYINTTGAPMTVQDEVTLQLAEPSELEAFVNDFVVLDTEFSVPAQSIGESVSTCTVPTDLSIVRLLGHAHEWGEHFKLEVVDEQDQMVEVLYEEDWRASYSSAPPMNRYTREEPLLLTAGTRLRQTCRWNNVEDYALEFPREMCLTYGIYYPDQGMRLFCDADPPTGQ